MSKKRELKREIHLYVANLIIDEFHNRGTGSEEIEELEALFGEEAVASAVKEIEAYHARLSGRWTRWSDGV